MQILVLLNFTAAIQGIFLTFLVLHKRLNETRSVVLGSLSLVLAISLLGGVYGLSGYYKAFPHFINVADPMFLLYGPLLFIYIFVLTQNRLPKFYFLHGIPFIAYIFSFIPLYLRSGEAKIEFAEYIFLNNEVPVEALIMQLARVVHISVYVFIGLFLIKAHQQKIKNNFSSIEKISLNQAKKILYFFLFVLLVASVSFILGYILSFSFSISNNIIGLFVGLIIYALAYSTWNKKNIQDHASSKSFSSNEMQHATYSPEINKGKKRSVFVLNDEQLEKFAGRLEKAIQVEKVFLENELSLNELSKKINIQPYQLSELLSRVYSESFFDFINRFRIEEIKLRLDDPKSESYSLLGIAMDCGFNSKSSFNSAFKKFTGITPSEYRKQNLANAVK